MNSQVVGLQAAGTIFGLVALAQFVRLIVRLEIIVAGVQVPIWPSAVGLVLAGALSYWMWRLSYMTAK